MSGLTMPAIIASKSLLIRLLFQRCLIPTPCGWLPSVLPRSNGSVSSTGYLAHPGYTSTPTACPNPSLTRLVPISHRFANGYASRYQSHSPDAISFVGTASSPINTNSLNITSNLLPPTLLQHLSSPEASCLLLRWHRAKRAFARNWCGLLLGTLKE